MQPIRDGMVTAHPLDNMLVLRTCCGGGPKVDGGKRKEVGGFTCVVHPPCRFCLPRLSNWVHSLNRCLNY